MSFDYLEKLGSLADPCQYQNTIDLSCIEKDVLSRLYSMMLLIRFAEMAIAELVQNGDAKCPCHLAVGQEAIATGIAEHLNADDYIFGNHRSHGHYLSLGSDLTALMAEVLGKASGCSGGMGGSMHLISEETGFKGSVPIVAGTISVATGAALAAKLNNRNQIAVSYFGDGSTEEGSFHESMNLAVVYNLPILFVCENNLYSSHLDISLRQPSDSISRYAKAHCMKSKVLDGNDVAMISKTSDDLINGIRSGQGPAFIECVTYRWFGHVGPDPNIDVGLRRSSKEVSEWKKRDPIKRLEDSMLASKLFNKKEMLGIKKHSETLVSRAVAEAMNAPYPDDSVLLELVYAGKCNG